MFAVLTVNFPLSKNCITDTVLECVFLKFLDFFFPDRKDGFTMFRPDERKRAHLEQGEMYKAGSESLKI